MCFTDFGETAATQVQSRLSHATSDGVLIGAGVRVPPGNRLEAGALCVFAGCRVEGTGVRPPPD
jgi:hypothetical protein